MAFIATYVYANGSIVTCWNSGQDNSQQAMTPVYYLTVGSECSEADLAAIEEKLDSELIAEKAVYGEAPQCDHLIWPAPVIGGVYRSGEG